MVVGDEARGEHFVGLTVVAEAPASADQRIVPVERAGSRLARLAGLSSLDELCPETRLLNLFHSPLAGNRRPGLAAARLAARDVVLGPGPTLLLGRTVQRAFGAGSGPLLGWASVPHRRGPDRLPLVLALCAPDPSGRCRWTNDPARRSSLREHVLEAAALAVQSLDYRDASGTATNSEGRRP